MPELITQSKSATSNVTASSSSYKSPKIRIALQSSGRLRKGSLDYLSKAGIQVDYQERELITSCTNSNFEILWVRDDDIPSYVDNGVADFGILGENVFYEKECRSKLSNKLNFCKCSLVIAIPADSKIKSINDLNNERIATTYPNLLSKYLKEKNIRASIIPIQGSVEIAPKLNLSDAICDLTQTGKTLKENSLKILDTILVSQAVLIQSPSLSSSKLKAADLLLSSLNQNSEL